MGSPGFTGQLTTYSELGFLMRRLEKAVCTCGVLIVVREAAQKAPSTVSGTPECSGRCGVVIGVG